MFFICSFFAAKLQKLLCQSPAGNCPLPDEPEQWTKEPFGNGAIDHKRRRGRGVHSNASGRFEREQRFDSDDGWSSLAMLEPFKTEVFEEPARSIISHNSSPDLSFSQTINPYRGCEHGCSYCFARPTHCFLGHSAGLDFETKLYAKPKAAQLLEQELGRPHYKPLPIVLGANTDPYQPIERQYKITRSVLEVLRRNNHPVAIVTKSALITRDLDILSEMAKQQLVKVALSITTLERRLARRMEPRATTPAKRLEALTELSNAGLRTSVMVAPIIPALNDMEIERILEAAKQAGVQEAGYVMLRLPLEVKALFYEWLQESYPDKENHVRQLTRMIHKGRDYDNRFALRRSGSGAYAHMIAKRFHLALRRLQLNRQSMDLRCDLFKPPADHGKQMELF